MAKIFPVGPGPEIAVPQLAPINQGAFNSMFQMLQQQKQSQKRAGLALSQIDGNSGLTGATTRTAAIKDEVEGVMQDRLNYAYENMDSFADEIDAQMFANKIQTEIRNIPNYREALQFEKGLLDFEDARQKDPFKYNEEAINNLYGSFQDADHSLSTGSFRGTHLYELGDIDTELTSWVKDNFNYTTGSQTDTMGNKVSFEEGPSYQAMYEGIVSRLGQKELAYIQQRYGKTDKGAIDTYINEKIYARVPFGRLQDEQLGDNTGRWFTEQKAADGSSTSGTSSEIAAQAGTFVGFVTGSAKQQPGVSYYGGLAGPEGQAVADYVNGYDAERAALDSDLIKDINAGLLVMDPNYYTPGESPEKSLWQAYEDGNFTQETLSKIQNSLEYRDVDGNVDANKKTEIGKYLINRLGTREFYNRNKEALDTVYGVANEPVEDILKKNYGSLDKAQQAGWTFTGNLWQLPEEILAEGNAPYNRSTRRGMSVSGFANDPGNKMVTLKGYTDRAKYGGRSNLETLNLKINRVYNKALEKEIAGNRLKRETDLLNFNIETGKGFIDFWGKQYVHGITEAANKGSLDFTIDKDGSMITKDLLEQELKVIDKSGWFTGDVAPSVQFAYDGTFADDGSIHNVVTPYISGVAMDQLTDDDKQNLLSTDNWQIGTIKNNDGKDVSAIVYKSTLTSRQGVDMGPALIEGLFANYQTLDDDWRAVAKANDPDRQLPRMMAEAFDVQMVPDNTGPGGTVVYRSVQGNISTRRVENLKQADNLLASVVNQHAAASKITLDQLPFIGGNKEFFDKKSPGIKSVSAALNDFTQDHFASNVILTENEKTKGVPNSLAISLENHEGQAIYQALKNDTGRTGKNYGLTSLYSIFHADNLEYVPYPNAANPSSFIIRTRK